MKAAVYYGIENVKVEEREKPVPGPKDVIVKNMCAGICGTDINAYYHGGEAYGILPDHIFGHEMAGVVVEVGQEVKDIPVGTRCFVNPVTIKAPGSAPAIQIADMAGAFGEYVRVENAEIDDNIFPLPDNVSFEETAIIEPFNVGNCAVNNGRAKAGEKCVVYGAGPIGLCAAAALKGKGIKDIVIIDLNDHRLEVAKKMDPDTFNPKTDGDLQSYLTQRFGSGPIGNAGNQTVDVDLFLDATGAPNVIPEFFQMCKRFARHVVIAVYKQAIEFNPLPMLNQECSIIGTGPYDSDMVKKVIGYLEAKNTGIENIITHRFKLDEINEAFKIARTDPQAIKMLIDYRE